MIVATLIPALDPAKWKPDDVLKAAALLGAAIAFAIGLLQYRKAQRWKRAEWVAQEMKTLFADPMVQAALFMIDWDAAYESELFHNRPHQPDEKLLDKARINAALAPHADRPGGFDDVERKMRAAFDRFFDGLERFSAYVDTNLVKDEDLKPYLTYWSEKICYDEAGRNSRANHLRVYMSTYGFRNALQLLGRLR